MKRYRSRPVTKFTRYAMRTHTLDRMDSYRGGTRL